MPKKQADTSNMGEESSKKGQASGSTRSALNPSSPNLSRAPATDETKASTGRSATTIASSSRTRQSEAKRKMPGVEMTAKESEEAQAHAASASGAQRSNNAESFHKYLTFALTVRTEQIRFKKSVPPRIPLVHMLRPHGNSKLHDRYMVTGNDVPDGSQQQAKPEKEEKDPTQELLAKYVSVSVWGEDTHVYIKAGLGANPKLETWFSADTGSSMLILSKQLADEFVQKNPQSTLLEAPQNKTANQIFTQPTRVIEGPVYKSSVDIGYAIENQVFYVSRSVSTTGILGLGSRRLTIGKIVGHENETVPTILDNLREQCGINPDSMGINIFPWKKNTDGRIEMKGNMHLGGVDRRAYKGKKIIYFPMPSEVYHGIYAGLSYGEDNKTIFSAGKSCILDTACPCIILKDSAFKRYLELTGATPPVSTDATNPMDTFPSIPKEKLLGLKRLRFYFGNGMRKNMYFDVTSDAQVFPPELSTKLGGNKDRLYLVFQPSKFTKEEVSYLEGCEYVFGIPLFQRFYFHIQLEEKSRLVGVARTEHTDVENPELAKIREEIRSEQQKVKDEYVELPGEHKSKRRKHER